MNDTRRRDMSGCLCVSCIPRVWQTDHRSVSFSFYVVTEGGTESAQGVLEGEDSDLDCIVRDLSGELGSKKGDASECMCRLLKVAATGCELSVSSSFVGKQLEFVSNS
jgi:hypothetical protein